MKRKSGRKQSKKDEENSNGVGDRSEQNGETSDHDEDDAPRDKRRKSSMPRRKSVWRRPEKEEAEESDKSEEAENDENDKKEASINTNFVHNGGRFGVFYGRKKCQAKSLPPRKTKKIEDESHSDIEDEEEDPPEHEIVGEMCLAVLRKSCPKRARKKPKKVATEPESSNDEDEDDESQYETLPNQMEGLRGGERHMGTRKHFGLRSADTGIQRQKKKSGGKKIKNKKKEPKPSNWDENEDFEVDKILEVHHRRDGKREFLVSWKGYSTSENSWEPEENMACKELIEKFMAKVEKARHLDERELRVHRPHVQRYTLSTQDSGRRLSKRFRGKERVQYHDAE
ncbi:hypothetical protein NQ317_004866 [Molorchus minor]|uniref:Chromo domain-containing protein n=1 Tax=Molorchus minor TaxID=1323400 RepID=A0ABQ9J8C7_9CUCU|nr:hypothetical protein NQ317_004866 [Molorchus minor]